MAKIYDRLGRTAVRLLNKYVENPETGLDEPNCLWNSQQEGKVTNSDEPWLKEKSEVEDPDFKVRIFFFSDELEDRQQKRYLKDTELGDGQVDGIMYYYEGLEPKLKDTITLISTKQELTVNAINPIPPAGLPVVAYHIEFGSA